MTKSNRDDLAEKIADLDMQLNACAQKRSKHLQLYMEADAQLGSMTSQKKKLTQELQGLDAEIELGLYRREVPYSANIYVLITDIRRPKKYTHVRGLMLNLDKGWTKARAYSFESNFSFMLRSMESAVKCEKLTFLTTEGYDLDKVIAILKDHRATQGVTEHKISSSSRFDRLVWRTHDYTWCDLDRKIKEDAIGTKTLKTE